MQYRPAPVRQVFFCSRTDSQLTQFVEEVQKSPYASDVRLISLGSRGSMCTNPSVRKLSSLSRINDKCKDLQEKASKSKDKASCLL